jgi:limonene-1,2-epoxide hydrolase
MDDIELVTAFLAALELKNLDSMLELMASDVHVHNMPIDPTDGHEAFRANTEAFMASVQPEQMRIEVLSIVATGGGYVVTERSDDFLIGGRWVRLPVAGIFEIRDGKIQSWREYFDMATFEKQLAAIFGESA